MAEAKKTEPKIETKKLSYEDLISNPAVVEMTRGAKPYARAPFGDSYIVYYVLFKDGANTLFGVYGIDGNLDSESQYILKDPNFEDEGLYAAGTEKRTIPQANVQYTMRFLEEKIKLESSRYTGKTKQENKVEFL